MREIAALEGAEAAAEWARRPSFEPEASLQEVSAGAALKPRWGVPWDRLVLNRLSWSFPGAMAVPASKGQRASLPDLGKLFLG